MIKKSNHNIRYLLLITILFVLSLFTINYYVISFGENFIYKQNYSSKNRIGLILGAGIKNNSEPTDILKDRLDTALEYYNNKLLSKIIVSGDNSKVSHNEPEVMKKYLIKKGIPKENIFQDHAGFDTYDSIYRAKAIFGVEKMFIFTQKYHLYRALYISNKLGIDTYGVTTDRHTYLGIVKFKSREMLSRIKAFFEVEMLKPKPKFLGDRIKIN